MVKAIPPTELVVTVDPNNAVSLRGDLALLLLGSE
jgi:hypothetical protein